MPPKAYLLSDGTSITAQELVNITGLSLPTCRVKLCKSKDPKFLFRNKFSEEENNEFRYKKYTLDDGSVTTVNDLMRKTGMSRKQAGYRLCKYTDPSKVFMKMKSMTEVEQTAREKLYNNKPINDRYHRMFMMMKTA